MCGIEISLPPSSPSVDFHILILLSETTEPTETKVGKDVHQKHLNSSQKTEGVSIYIFDHLLLWGVLNEPLSAFYVTIAIFHIKGINI